MIAKVLAVLGFMAVAYAADLTVGMEGGRLIFDQNITASPAIWKQVKLLTVNATNNTEELISRVVVIDNRAEKDGEATVVEGGEGQRNVMLELKSPAVFRGFDFSIQVFANEPNVYGRGETQLPQVPAHFPNHPGTTGIDTQNPQVLKDLKVNSNQEPKDVSDIIIGAPAPTASSATEENKEDQQKINPALVGKDQPRLNRDTEEQKTKKQTSVSTPVEVDASKDTKINEDAKKTELPEMEENLKKILDSIFENTKHTKINEDAKKTELPDMEENLKKVLDSIFGNNSTQKTEKEDTQKVVPAMPQAESDDLINLRDDDENRKVLHAVKEPVVTAVPKELTNDDHTTPKNELSSTTQKVGQEKSVPEVTSTTEKDAGQEKSVPTIVTVPVPSTTQANKLSPNCPKICRLHKNSIITLRAIIRDIPMQCPPCLT